MKGSSKLERLKKAFSFKPTTVAGVGTCLVWLYFNVTDPTPPAVLDQLVVAVFSVWFTSEAVEKRKQEKKKGELEETEGDGKPSESLNEKSGDTT